MDLSIKVNFKVSSKWADNSPVISGIIFTIHKLKYHIISSTSIINLFKKTKKIYVLFFKYCKINLHHSIFS